MGSHQHSNIQPNEGGYVLITAIWLLLIAAALLAILVAQNERLNKNIRFEQKFIARQMALESGLQNIIADSVNEISQGKPLSIPVIKRYQIGGFNIIAQLIDENGKLDVNNSDPELIRRALQGLGVSSDIAVNFTQQLTRMRKAQKKISSLEEIDLSLEAAGLDQTRSGFCPRRYFTIYATSGEPDVRVIRPELAQALAIPASPIKVEEASNSISVLAIQVSEKAGAGYFARISPGFQSERIFNLLHSHHGRECGI
jgi:hypothetical protein